MNIVNLKTQLHAYLRHYDITAAQLARRAGISKQVIGTWLSGTSPRKLEQVKLVADELKTTVDHLCFGEGIEIKQSPLEEHKNEIQCGLWEVILKRPEKGKR